MCNRVKLEFKKKKSILNRFSLKNIKFGKELWVHQLSTQTEIGLNLSLVDYIPATHAYKVKPQYLEKVKDFIKEKARLYGIAEKIIDCDQKYTITMMSLINFFEQDYYNEEIINALFSLY